MGEEIIHRTLGKPKKKAPARVLWAKRAGVFGLWALSMVFFRMGAGGTVGDCFGYLAGMVQGLSPVRFGSELYAAAYNGFYANSLMVGGYYAFALLALALGIWMDHRRCFVHRNRPAEEMLAALPIRRRQVAYLVNLPDLGGVHSAKRRFWRHGRVWNVCEFLKDGRLCFGKGIGHGAHFETAGSAVHSDLSLVSVLRSL